MQLQVFRLRSSSNSKMLQSNPSPAQLAERTVANAKAKTAYFDALRAAMPELENIALAKSRGHVNWTRLLQRSRSLAKNRKL
jgi:hypothetical protein